MSSGKLKFRIKDKVITLSGGHSSGLQGGYRKRENREMNPVRGIVNSLVVDSPLPSNVTYLWGFGSILGLALVIQILTGVFLAMHYVADTELAFMSVEHIMRDTVNGWILNLEGSEQREFNLALVLIGRMKERGKLVYDIYRNSWLGEAIKDPEGDLMPKSIERYTDTKIFKYSFVVIFVLSLISRWVFRLSKITGLSLYSEVLAIGCTISIMLFYSIVLMKALGVMYTFGNRVVSGYYMTGGGVWGGG